MVISFTMLYKFSWRLEPLLADMTVWIGLLKDRKNIEVLNLFSIFYQHMYANAVKFSKRTHQTATEFGIKFTCILCLNVFMHILLS